MDLEKQNQAAEYAKARVQQIRQKIYNPIVNKAKHISMSNQSKYNQRMIIKRQSKQQKYPKREITPKQKDPQSKDYHNRIQNIDSINDRIRNVLGQRNFMQKSIKKNKPIINMTERQPLVSIIPTKKSVLGQVNRNIKDIGKSIQKPITNLKSNNFQVSIQLTSARQSFVEEIKPEDNILDSYKPFNIKKRQLPQIKIEEYQQSLKSKSTSTVSRQQQIFKQQQILSKRRQQMERQYHKQYKIQSIQKVQIKKLAEMMGKQIQIDQELRQQRFTFMQLRNQNKWEILYSQIKNINSRITMGDLKNQIIITSQEHNPFFQSKKDSTEECIQNLIDIYCRAKLFWQQKLTQCVFINKLQDEGFNITDIDLNKKGYLSIEDLVCFINLHSGSFFRNRDTVTLFKRFIVKGQTGIKYENFLQKVTRS